MTCAQSRAKANKKQQDMPDACPTAYISFLAFCNYHLSAQEELFEVAELFENVLFSIEVI